jgi:hypothetical protein
MTEAKAGEGIRFNVITVSSTWYRGVSDCIHGTSACDYYQILPWSPIDAASLEHATRRNHDLKYHCNCAVV